jgi:hypothetical protein
MTFKRTEQLYTSQYSGARQGGGVGFLRASSGALKQIKRDYG